MDFSLTQQQRDIKKAAAEFAHKEFLPEVAQDHELNHRYPRELFKKAAQLGFIGLDYPERIGGGGMGVMENVLVIEEFCKADSGLGMALHLGYVPSKVIKVVGSPQQQEKFLGPLVKGNWISAIAMTEPDHGSDLTRMETTLVEEEDGFAHQWHEGLYHQWLLCGFLYSAGSRRSPCGTWEGDEHGHRGERSFVMARG